MYVCVRLYTCACVCLCVCVCVCVRVSDYASHGIVLSYQNSAQASAPVAAVFTLIIVFTLIGSAAIVLVWLVPAVASV